MTSSSIPDGLSSADLQHMLDQVKNDKAPLADATPEELVNLITEIVDPVYEQMGSVFAFKLIADYCLYQLFQHHNETYHAALQDDEADAALCWARDAGQLQVLAKTLEGIHCGPQDFQCPPN